jgi:hypothetical protein
VAATSNMRMPSVISIWVYEVLPPGNATASSVKAMLDNLVNLVLLIAAIVFMYKYVNSENMVSKHIL